jgi:hypothetical protein
MTQQSTDALVPQPLPLKEVATLLIRSYQLHEGLWDLALEMQVGIGQVGLARADLLPGAMIRVSRIGLAKTLPENAGPNTVNAAEVNPVAR